MKSLNRFFARLTNFATGGHTGKLRTDQRLLEEMEEHIAQQTADNLRAGMSSAEAHRKAVLKFGPIGAIRESYHGELTLPIFETTLQDMRYAFRMLLRSPGFSFIAIATMALGIGATTAIYSVIDATLLHPLPFPNPSELVSVQDDLIGLGARDVGVSIPEFRDLQNSGIFQSLSIAGHGANVNLTGTAQPERLGFKAVTPNYFAVLGVNTQLGRTLDPHDTTPGYNLEVVLSDGLWRSGFGADPKIIGKALRLDNDLYHVVGVMPRGFRDQGSTSEEQNVDLWLGAGYSGLPFPPPQRSLRLHRAVIARLKPGLSVTAAQAQIDALTASLKKEYPADYPPLAAWNVRLVPLSESVVGSVRQSLVLLFGAVALVLLISCVNVANLLLARASGRGREIAVRQALGAQRMRLIRQFLSESLLLFLLGGTSGIAVLFIARKFLLRLIPESLPHMNDISINWGVLAFALALSVIAGTVFGLAPAWLVSRFDLIGTLRQEGRGAGGSRQRSRARQLLVVGELALSLVLMVAAGLLLHSFWDLFQVHPGFNPERVMTLQSWLPGPNDPSTDNYRTATQESVLFHEILRRSRTLPGVEQAAIGDTTSLPLGHGLKDLIPLSFLREGIATKDNEAPIIDSSIVSPEYFNLLGMPLLYGRAFTDQDIETTPRVAIINEAAARIWWPNQNPVGKRICLLSKGLSTREFLNSARPPWTTIIGVVANARTESLTAAVNPQIYRSIYQSPTKELVIFLRGQLDPGAIPWQVRDQVWAIDPQLPVFHAQTLEDVLSTSLSVRRFSMEMVALFAGTALLLAGLGIYGTFSYLVNEQRREIAIRLAMGAPKGKVLRMVLHRGFNLAAVGAALGVIGALLVSHLMAGLLYGVSPNDPITFIGFTLVLILVALAACYIPARRAMRVDPIVALREA
jgi:putative ABC transport system permease protein